jgi:hypothetical protein
LSLVQCFLQPAYKRYGFVEARWRSFTPLTYHFSGPRIDGIMARSITMPGTTTFSIIDFIVTLGINAIMLSVVILSVDVLSVSFFDERHYSECYDAECRGAK